MNTAGPRDVPAGKGLELTPFRGLRYDPDRVGSLAAVTSPPYDVVVRPDGLLHLESADPHNIVRLILPQAATPAARNKQAAHTLRRWLDEGVLRADAEPGLYIYEQRGNGLLQRGVIGALRVSQPSDGVVLPHEDVMPHVIADRAALMRATSANLEPLLLTYRGSGDATGAGAVIERTAERSPLLRTTTEDGFSHRLWAVTDPAEVAEIQSELAQHQALIADGHHRWATYLRLRAEHGSPSPWDYGLVLLVDTARYPLRATKPPSSRVRDGGRPALHGVGPRARLFARARTIAACPSSAAAAPPPPGPTSTYWPWTRVTGRATSVPVCCPPPTAAARASSCGTTCSAAAAPR
ncbi:DUF1015 domain-containing protein [Streptomyces sp. NPDC001215]